MLSTRIEQVRAQLGYTKAKMSEMFGISATYYTAISNGTHKGNVQIEHISTLVDIGVNAQWLFTGDGDMWQPGRDPNQGYQVRDGQPQFIPNCALYPQPANAGGGVYADLQADQVTRIQLPGITDTPGMQYRTFYIQGDSMAPMWANGDLAICTIISDPRSIRPYLPVVAITADGVFLKNLLLTMTAIEFHSLDTSPPFTLDHPQVFELWQPIRRITAQLVPPPNTDLTTPQLLQIIEQRMKNDK
jgi:transcriptional regulator with XRE-family HTH domain